LKISAVIITYNEERNIARCIDSLKNIADEILVIDSYSNDKTLEICQAKEVKIIQNKFEGYIEQKNFATSKASYNHILSLDADEALSPELASSILHTKSNWNHDGYEVSRKTNYCGKWIRFCGWYPDKKLRLFDRTKGQWGGLNPHDKLCMVKSATLSGLKGDLLHYPYTNIKDHLKRVDAFTSIMAEEAVKKNKKSGVFFLILSPWVKFIKSYFIQLGILDGYHGFVICTISAFATFVKYAKIIELKQRKH
jgi:glycosyltransferase involved in cell wall biosynthesis